MVIGSKRLFLGEWGFTVGEKRVRYGCWFVVIHCSKEVEDIGFKTIISQVSKCRDVMVDGLLVWYAFSEGWIAQRD